MAWNDASNRHSDKERFRSDLNRPKGREMSERLLKTSRKFGDFQAEYEGSIPFTRSISISFITWLPQGACNDLHSSRACFDSCRCRYAGRHSGSEPGGNVMFGVARILQELPATWKRSEDV
jgi:hypothetical protein